MKYALLLLGSSLCLPGAAHAQLGVRAGSNWTQYDTGAGQVVQSSSQALTGFQVGITYKLPIEAHLALVPEGQYSYERLNVQQISTAFSGFTAATQWRLHYLNLPVVVRVTFGPVYVEAGPQAGVLLGGRQTGTQVVTNYTTGSQPKSSAIDQAATETTARLDVGACIGLGLKLPANLGLSLRAYQGLVASNGAASSYEGGYRRQTLQASLTYQLTKP